ncbi:MAG: FG-GAP repeat protein [Planctomycetes bacterium]|nr:FG-GAP repeat protein [Planctomycetota bacterium]MBI3834424.1 FG-GAP repeat protein [Planctomycetota bacterium]
MSRGSVRELGLFCFLLLTATGSRDATRVLAADCNGDGIPDDVGWQPQGVLHAADGKPGDELGWAVAVEGDLIVVGAPRDGTRGTDSGAAYVFRRQGDTWIQEAKLIGSDTRAGDDFGIRLAVHNGIVAVGAYGRIELDYRTGAVYVFEQNNAVWQQTTKLLPFDLTSEHYFGESVSFGDKFLVVGSPHDDIACEAEQFGHCGAAYLFRHEAGQWVFTQTLVAKDAHANDEFGYAVAIFEDTILIGAHQAGNSGPTGSLWDGRGGAYVFERDGGVWRQTAKLIASNPLTDGFGVSVAITSGFLAVGAEGDNFNGVQGVGAVYIFERIGTGWHETQRLGALDAKAWDILGGHISADWGMVVATATVDNPAPSQSMAAYVFKKSTSGWTQEAKLLGSPSTGAIFTGDVGVSGSTLVLGDTVDNANGGSSGAARVFHGFDDCNHNGVLDECDIAGGASIDCDANGIPDECQQDCNANGIADTCDITAGFSSDCDNNHVPDECEPDCNHNGVADKCDATAGTSLDCNSNLVPDECEPDCNHNGVPDSCDLAFGTSLDCNHNHIPDDCEGDCNANSVPDDCDIASGTSKDCNSNHVPDECDTASGSSHDCNLNHIPDECETDCNHNSIPDDCDIASGFSADCTGNGIADECEPDCNHNSVADTCDILNGTSLDLDSNGYPDECQQILRVPSQYPTIKAAVTAAKNGDTVLIADGAYSGSGNYYVYVPKDVIIRSENGPFRTTIDLQSQGNAFGFDPGSGWYTQRLEGITFRNGYNSQGGAVSCGQQAKTRITNCVFNNNRASNRGGGAIWCWTGSRVTIDHCVMTNNAGYEKGGAIFNEGGNTTIRNSVITGNFGGFGGGGVCAGGSVMISDSLITDNLSYEDGNVGGGGLAASDGSHVGIRNCTLSNNKSSAGGAVYATDDSTVDISNSILRGDRAPTPIVGIAVTARYCDVQGGWPGVGNFDADPLFFAPQKSAFHLAHGSPCIDAGDPSYTIEPNETDIDDQARIFHGLIDIGADEYQPYDCNNNGLDDALEISMGQAADCNRNYIPDDCDLADGASLDNIPVGGDGIPDDCQSDCNSNGVEDSVDIRSGASSDCNSNNIPDECELRWPALIHSDDVSTISGILIPGFAAYGYLGGATGGVDVNGDGWTDLIIGNPAAAPNGQVRAGAAYVVFGGPSFGNGDSIDLNALDGSNGFRIEGAEAGANFGNSIAALGDFNDDGFDDFAIAAFYANPGGIYSAGKTYVFFGKPDLGASGLISIAALPSDELVINGISSQDSSGEAIGAAGDINHDGIPDLAIGARMATRSGVQFVGEAYVVFGNNSLTGLGHLELSSLNGSNGFIFKGRGYEAYTGSDVRGVGDVNGDGIDDMVISAAGAPVGNRYSIGDAFVLFGSPTIGASGILAPEMINGANGFVIHGTTYEGYFGAFSSPAGDVNGDGHPDLIFSEPGASPAGLNDAGKVYVVYGKVGLGASGVMEIGSLTPDQGFSIPGIAAGEYLWNAGGIGDFNDDGFADLFIGAQNASPDGIGDAGKTYVIFGGPNVGASGSVSLLNLNGSNGFVLRGTDYNDVLGAGVGRIGDVNGDGVNDLAIAANGVDLGPLINAGMIYILPGRRDRDCDHSGTLDVCEPQHDLSTDCNDNHYPDYCEIAKGRSFDINHDGIPDQCETILGACCTTSSGDFQCLDDIIQSECAGENQAWHALQHCADDPCYVAPTTGACCSHSDFSHSCRENALEGDCSGAGNAWYPNTSCSEINCTQFVPIPTLSEWGMVELSLVLLIMAKWIFQARPRIRFQINQTGDLGVAAKGRILSNRSA